MSDSSPDSRRAPRSLDLALQISERRIDVRSFAIRGD
jgi:hypothetical protein